VTTGPGAWKMLRSRFLFYFKYREIDEMKKKLTKLDLSEMPRLPMMNPFLNAIGATC
jgi:hypothetical protein